MTTVATIDFDEVFDEITARLKADRKRRLRTPQIRLWDGDWNLVGEVHREITASFQTLNNETGIGKIEMPARYYLSKWMTDVDRREGAKNIFVTVDYNGTRWSGCVDEVEQYKDTDGQRNVRVTIKHDYEHLKHVLVYSNPWFPPEFQFPRLWIAFGRARWALKLTLMVNIMRLESSLWALPDDPLNLSNWFNFDQSTWSQVVSPLSFGADFSQFAIVHSRFKNMHDVSKRIVADAQLTWEPRRYLDGDPDPWPGANLRHGCLVWDLVDHSGWDSETSFGGNIFSGLIRAFTSIGSDGMTEGIDVINDPTFPIEYSTPGYHGTVPRAPGIILRDGKRTGVQSNSFKWRPATDVGVVTGGHSMPGVNELISAAINMAGDLIAAAIFIPPIGGMVDAILKPLYCLAGDTIIDGPDGPERIDVLAARGGPFRVWSITPEGDRVSAIADFAFKKGTAELYECTLADGRTLTATAQHRWLTRSGWLEVENSPVGTEVATVDHSRAGLGDVGADAPSEDLPDAAWPEIHDGAAVEYSPVVSVRSVGVQDFYDMHVPGWVSYSGNGIWCHNTDVILAFMKWKDIGRAQDLGFSHYHETFGQGGDRAYTLSALIALRTGMWLTREQTSHTVVIADGTENLRIGQNGKGNAYIGTRVGTSVKDWGTPGKVYVDRISELTLGWSRTESPAFKITIGQRPDEDPILKGLEMIQEVFSIAQELGVL